MKSKISILCLSVLFLLFTSCKKESTTSIVGQWRSVSFYSTQDNGIYNWVSVDGRPQFYNFSTEGRFGSATDVPGGSGSYNYDETLQKLTLHFEADTYGNLPGTKNLKVETLDRDKMILSYSPTSGVIYKTEYLRIN
ncbi:MAG TPA: hypothetical protein VGQ53_05950 [Chitinophagaceae bacterium]|jgi:hypothetical protein|nr:hypothetical protein [Chitinophagaceae bacterium]